MLKSPNDIIDEEGKFKKPWDEFFQKNQIDEEFVSYLQKTVFRDIIMYTKKMEQTNYQDFDMFYAIELVSPVLNNDFIPYRYMLNGLEVIPYGIASLDNMLEHIKSHTSF